MVRVKGGTTTRHRHHKMLKRAKGYRQLGSRVFVQAKNKVALAGQHSYAHRRLKKRTFRGLWIIRLNAGCRALGFKYSEFSGAITRKGLLLNRRVLSELAIKEPAAFEAAVKQIMA